MSISIRIISLHVNHVRSLDVAVHTLIAFFEVQHFHEPMSEGFTESLLHR